MALDDSGRLLTSAAQGYALSLPRPGWVELDPSLVWQASSRVLRRLRSRLRHRSTPALAVSASVDDVIFVDRSGNPVGPSIMALDTRSAAEGASFFRQIGVERLHAITGLPPAPVHPLIRLLWLRTHRPAEFERVRSVLGWGEWIATRLGLEAVTDPSQAARSMAWDVRASRWSAELLDAAQLDPALFPLVRPTADPIGRLADGTLVVVGGADQYAAALGAGVSEPGEAMVGTGSWEALTVVTADPATGPGLVEGGYAVGPYVLPGRFAAMATSVGGATMLRWLTGVLAAPGERPARLAGLPRQPTGLLVLPHINGAYSPWLDPGSRAAIVGFGLATTRGELLKAGLEGITFELRDNVERLARAGVTFNSLRATGGGARSATWLQLKADILNRPVERLTSDDTGAIGAACLAAAGSGGVASAAELARQAVRVRSVFEPRPRWAALYEERFARYLELYPALRRLRQLPAASAETRRS